MEWTRSRARRAILKYAIQMIMPVPEHADSLSFIGLKPPATSAGNNPLARFSHSIRSSALSSSYRFSKGGPSRIARFFSDARGATS